MSLSICMNIEMTKNQITLVKLEMSPHFNHCTETTKLAIGYAQD